MPTRKAMYNEYKHLWMLGRLYKNREEYNKLQKQLSTDWNKIKNEKETQGKAGVLGVTQSPIIFIDSSTRDLPSML